MATAPVGDDERSWQQLRVLLRQRICAGEWRRGEALPSRTTLSRHYRCSLSTLDWAIRGLESDGYIYRRPRVGTFVMERLPFEFRFALGFGPTEVFGAPHGSAWPAFFEVLREASCSFPDQEIEMVPIIGLVDDPLNPIMAELLADLHAGRLGGVILAVFPHLLPRCLPLLRDFGLVTIGANPCGLPAVTINEMAMWKLAAKQLASDGCQRPTVVMNLRYEMSSVSKVTDLFGAHGLELEAKHVWQLPLGHPSNQVQAGTLIADALTRGEIDGVALLDDNLVPRVSRSIATQLGSAANSIPCVAHANHPSPTPCAMPAYRFGPDAHEILDLAIGRCRNPDGCDLAATIHCRLHDSDSGGSPSGYTSQVPRR